MANEIVPQTAAFCKVENNPRVNNLIQQYSISDLDYKQEVARVLSIGNDSAVDFLKSVGFDGIIPGTHFALLQDMADFLGVSKDRLASSLNSHGFNSVTDRKEAITRNIADFFRTSGLLNCGKIVANDSFAGVFDYCMAGTGEHYVTKNTSSRRLFTARAYLSTLPPLRRKIKWDEDNSKLCNIYEELLEYVRQCEWGVCMQRIAPAYEPVEPVVSQPAPQPVQLAQATVSVTKDELLNLIKQAVKEAMADKQVEIPATFTIKL